MKQEMHRIFRGQLVSETTNCGAEKLVVKKRKKCLTKGKRSANIFKRSRERAKSKELKRNLKRNEKSS